MASVDRSIRKPLGNVAPGVLLPGRGFFAALPREGVYNRQITKTTPKVSTASPPSKSHRHNDPITGMGVVIHLAGWNDPYNHVDHGMPIIGGYRPDPAAASWNGIPSGNPIVYPPYSSGTVNVRGLNDVGGSGLWDASLTSANSAGVVFQPDPGWFDLTFDMDGNDMANINGGGWAEGMRPVGSIPNVDTAVIWWVEWRLFR